MLLLGRRPRDHRERHAGGIEQKHQVVQPSRSVPVHEAGQTLAAPTRSFKQVGSLVPACLQPSEHEPDRGILNLSGSATGALGRLLRQRGPASPRCVLAELAWVRGVHPWSAAIRRHRSILAPFVTLDVTNECCVRVRITFSWLMGRAAHTVGMTDLTLASTATSPSSYNPMLASATWSRVQPFVDEVTAERCAGMSRRQIDEHQRTLAYFGDWVVQTGMVQLDEALAADVIDVYTEDRAREVVRVMAERERKMLRRLAGIAPSVEKRAVSTASEPERPYSDDELATFHHWASYQRTEHQGVACMAIFALSVGCGLTSGEILAVRGSDLLDLDGVLAVRVARDGRVVPVVDRWRGCFEKVLANATGELLVAPNATDRKGAMQHVLRASTGSVKPTAARLRMTWLVAHLEAGTPLAALLPASGMTSTDSLRRAMSYVRPMPVDASYEALRMLGASR